MKILALALSVAFAEPVITTGVITSFTVNGEGLVVKFVVDTNGAAAGGEVTFTTAPPSEALSDVIREAKEAGSDVEVTDQDGDNKFESADTMTVS